MTPSAETDSPLAIDDAAPWVRRIVLDRPATGNRIDARTIAALAEALRDAVRDDAVRVVVLAGAGGVFSEGGDVEEMAAFDALTIQNDASVADWKLLRGFSKPMIAAVEGDCLGAGNEVALMADFIVAGRSARFGQPEVGLGVIPGAGGTQRLAHAVGKPMAMKMCLTGLPIGADEARSSGLVAEVVADGGAEARALELASVIASQAPRAVRLAKTAILKAYEHQLAHGLAFERDAYCSLFSTEDRLEGIAAFREGRPPTFKGR